MAIVPLLAERVHNEEIDRADRVQAAYKQALSLAHQAAAAQGEVFISARAFLQVVSSARKTFNPSDEACNQFLASIAAPIPWVHTLSVANLQGKIVCSSYPHAIGLDISNRSHFLRAVDSGDFVLSDYFVSTRSNTPIITAALAQPGQNGAASAVLLSTLDLRWFEQIARSFAVQHGSVLLLDGAGTVMAKYPDRQKYLGRKFANQPLVHRMLTSAEGVTTEDGIDGVRRIFAYVQLPGTEARFAVGFDEQEIMGRANREMWVAFTELGIVVLIVLLGIWAGCDRLLVRPIRALTQAAARIGRGELKDKANALHWASEFVPLAAALDDMSDKLEARETELRESNAQLRELAQIDALTGLANRRTFNSHLATEWDNAAKLRHPIAVLMIDVDHFKLFNDCYGHLGGDTCLRKVSAVLKGGGRLSDSASLSLRELSALFERTAGRHTGFAARYGGEEFAVLLQGADLEEAARVAERLRRGVEDLLIAHAGAPLGFVSISVGVASIVPAANDDPQSLTEAADAALYEAKKQGRNRVVAPQILAYEQAS